jgi:hypothetical protein
MKEGSVKKHEIRKTNEKKDRSREIRKEKEISKERPMEES